jgi:AcrR family transcriptional regulator
MIVPRAGLTADGVVRTALEIVDEGGPEALTLATLASRSGVATPSLYKHVGSLADLRSRVAARVLGEITDVATAAVVGRSGDDAVAALMRELRAYALAHPNRYIAVPADPAHDPALVEPAGRLLDVFFAVLRGFQLDQPAAVHATRCLRVIVHGFAAIESAGGFGFAEDPGVTYDLLIDMFIASLHRR